MEQFKKELKQYTNSEMRIVEEVCDFCTNLLYNMECINTEQYEANHAHLLSLKKKFRKFDSIVCLLEQMIMKLDLDFNAYIANLERLHPECWERSEKYSERLFRIDHAESLELQRLRNISF